MAERWNPESWRAKPIVQVPDYPDPTKIPVTRQDSINNYNEYKKHFWDGISFMDDRIIRTPFFLKKIERYYREVISPDADTIIKDVDYKLLLARSAPEMYKFFIISEMAPNRRNNFNSSFSDTAWFKNIYRYREYYCP